MAGAFNDAFWSDPKKGQYEHPVVLPPTVVKPPSTGGATGGVNDVPGASGGGGPSAASVAAAAAAAAESKAKSAGKAQTAKENTATQQIIDALIGSLKGFANGRDTQIGNANQALNETLNGILQNYTQAVGDYSKSEDANDQDQAAKTAANLTNRARERLSLLQQAASQGAGETDQLRAQVQAFLNSDANQQEVDRAYTDTGRQIMSQIAGANSQSETQRRSAWAQNQEAIGSAMNDYYKNYTDTWTNIQRTAAQNNNVDSDYSTAFSADVKGNDAVAEASKFAGTTYQAAKKDDDFFRDWQGKTRGRETKSTTSNKAAATTISAPKAAEGATLRGRTW